MLNLENLHVVFEIAAEDGVKNMPGDKLSVLPSVGDEIEMNYVEGVKISFVVTAVKHHLSSIGDNLFQQIKIVGEQV